MIVMDSSAAMNIALGTIEGKGLSAQILPNEKVISSELMKIEVCSAVRKYIKAGYMSLEQARDTVEKAIDLVDVYQSISDNYQESLCASDQYDHSVYDMLYATLARRNNATLFTTDRKLMRTCEKMHVNCLEVVTLPD